MVTPVIEADAIDEEQLPTGFVVGEYRVDKLLGVGGFARVYQANHPVLRHQVAVKVLTRAVGSDPEAMRRFVREAQAASRIDHENVVKVLGFGKLQDGRAYQLMELVHGPTLDDYLGLHGKLTVLQALSFLQDIAAALTSAHALGITHRDLKPANVLLANQNGALMAKLTDFGIATALDGEHDSKLTRTGSTLGTPTYMSPEQALGTAINTSSDVYAFGVLAFELLTNAVPFDGESPFAIMMQHVQATPPRASQIAPELGPHFDQAILQMLNKHPEDRPASVAAAMALLHAAATTTSGVEASSCAAVPATPRRIKRTATIIALAAVVGIGLAALAWNSTGAAPSKNLGTSMQSSTGSSAPSGPRTMIAPSVEQTSAAARVRPATVQPPAPAALGSAAATKPTFRNQPSVRPGPRPDAASSNNSNRKSNQDTDSIEIPPDYPETP